MEITFDVKQKTKGGYILFFSYKTERIDKTLAVTVDNNTSVDTLKVQVQDFFLSMQNSIND
jgi:hypothetical protein